MNMEAKLGLLKKPKGTKSVRDASNRKHDENQDVIGSFTENLSYLNEVNALSHQVKANYQDPSMIQKNEGGDNDRQAQQPRHSPYNVDK